MWSVACRRPVFAVLTRSSTQATQVVVQAAAQETAEIESLLRKSYLEVLEISPALEFSSDQFQTVRKRLEQEEKQKKNTQKEKQKSIEKLPLIKISEPTKPY